MGDPPSLPISRRRALQLAGLAGSGLAIVMGGKALRRRQGISMSPSLDNRSLPETNNSLSTGSSLEVSSIAELPLESIEDSRIEFNVVTVDTQGAIVTAERQQAEFRREILIDGLNLDLITIPGGTFAMGTAVGEPLRRQDQGPQHNVSVPAFLMGKYQVTQAQWRAVATFPKIEHDLDPDPAAFKGDNRPVERVSWYDAVEFCARLSHKTGREYRLASEAEWEYACRAGTETPFHFGETITTEVANHRSMSTYVNGAEGKHRNETTEVGSFNVANNFGLYDMHGNVWEWCLDYYHNSYVGAPVDGSARTSAGDGAYRVLRGGACRNFPRACRSAYRYWFAPEYTVIQNGFRVVCATPWEA